VYVPPFNAVEDDDEIRAMVAAGRVAWLVTTHEGVPEATLLPIMWHDDTVIAHMAIANQQWRHLEAGTPALLICPGPDAYISPTWYAAKAEHGKVVPTWNYTAVHLTGTVQVHQDPEWLREAVTELTRTHESERQRPWAVTDAPEPYVEGQLRGIVGVEFTVTKVEGKAKLSQNRSLDDRTGVVAGLHEEPYAGAQQVAELMDSKLHA
jgi:transcriptional regulator